MSNVFGKFKNNRKQVGIDRKGLEREGVFYIPVPLAAGAITFEFIASLKETAQHGREDGAMDSGNPLSSGEMKQLLCCDTLEWVFLEPNEYEETSKVPNYLVVDETYQLRVDPRAQRWNHLASALYLSAVSERFQEQVIDLPKHELFELTLIFGPALAYGRFGDEKELTSALERWNKLFKEASDERYEMERASIRAWERSRRSKF